MWRAQENVIDLSHACGTTRVDKEARVAGVKQIVNYFCFRRESSVDYANTIFYHSQG